MSDLSDLNSVSGTSLTGEQLDAILAQIDLDVLNVLRDGKLAAVKYTLPGGAGLGMDRAANLQALLQARDYYQRLKDRQPGWEISVAE